MISFTVGEYKILCSPSGPATIHAAYREHAVVLDEFDMEELEGETCFVSVQKQNNFPFLVVAQRYSPAQPGFDPGIALIPETHILFIGAGTRLLAYQLDTPRRLWEDTCDTGFWFWTRHGDYVVMSAELELAAWDIKGQKLWSTFVEPPWNYTVVNDDVQLDVMGQKTSFPLSTGLR